MYYASRTMNSAERNYSACEREALAVIFALKKFRMYLLSTEPFKLITDHQALREAFRKEDIHGRLARWLDFLAEYEVEIAYRPGDRNKAADFLSRHSNIAPIEGDEGDLVFTTVTEASSELLDGMEPPLQEVIRHLSNQALETDDKNLRKNIRRGSKYFVLWEDKLFRRTGKGLRVVAPMRERVKILRCFHVEMGHWDRAATMELVTDRFWWPSICQDVERYVRTCDSCQRMKPLPPYASNMKRPTTGLFDVFYIDFSGPFPRHCEGGPRYLLICVEHLTGWPILKPTWDATSKTVRGFMEKEVIHPFGAPKVVVSDNAGCFTAHNLVKFMDVHGTKWKPVAAYAPMSNGKAERMVGTIKKDIGRLVEREPTKWAEKCEGAVAGYRKRRASGSRSPFELLYGVQPCIMPEDVRCTATTEDGRCVELMAAEGTRAAVAVN